MTPTIDAPLDEGPFAVGKTYVRPAVLARNIWFPILHEHVGDLSGVHHFHADARFLSTRTYKQLGLHPALLFAIPLVDVDHQCNVQVKCVRQFIPPLKRLAEINVERLAIIEGRNKDKICNGKVCPHQGCDLTAVRPTNGTKICPCHGLQWDMETGRMIPRQSLTVLAD